MQLLPRETSAEIDLNHRGVLHRRLLSLSRAEAELYAVVRAAAAGIGWVSMLWNLGVVLQKQES